MALNCPPSTGKFIPILNKHEPEGLAHLIAGSTNFRIALALIADGNLLSMCARLTFLLMRTLCTPAT